MKIITNLNELITKNFNKFLKNYFNNKYMRCSMESHSSHILADLVTARPKAYSKK